MKNIFRKAVQKVRNTTAKVFNTIRENSTLGVAAAGVVLMLGGTIYKILKTDEEVFGPIGYDADSLAKTFQHVYDAFKAGYESSEESPCVAVNMACPHSMLMYLTCWGYAKKENVW